MAYRDIKELLSDAKNIAKFSTDLQLKKAMQEMQDCIYELLEENRNLREEIHELKNVELTTKELVYRGNAYYHLGQGPFCATCWDSQGKLIRLSLNGDGWRRGLKGVCGNCSTSVITDIPDPNYIDIENRGF